MCDCPCGVCVRVWYCTVLSLLKWLAGDVQCIVVAVPLNGTGSSGLSFGAVSDGPASMRARNKITAMQIRWKLPAMLTHILRQWFTCGGSVWPPLCLSLQSWIHIVKHVVCFSLPNPPFFLFSYANHRLGILTGSYILRALYYSRGQFVFCQWCKIAA